MNDEFTQEASCDSTQDWSEIVDGKWLDNRVKRYEAVGESEGSKRSGWVQRCPRHWSNRIDERHQRSSNITGDHLLLLFGSDTCEDEHYQCESGNVFQQEALVLGDFWAKGWGGVVVLVVPVWIWQHDPEHQSCDEGAHHLGKNVHASFLNIVLVVDHQGDCDSWVELGACDRTAPANHHEEN